MKRIFALIILGFMLCLPHKVVAQSLRFLAGYDVDLDADYNLNSSLNGSSPLDSMKVNTSIPKVGAGCVEAFRVQPYVEYNKAWNLTNKNQMTFRMWYRTGNNANETMFGGLRNSLTTAWSLDIFKRSDVNGHRVRLDLRDDLGAPSYYWFTALNEWIPENDTWYHLEFDIDTNGSSRFFVNGCQVGSTITPNFPRPYNVGKIRVGQCTWFQSTIDYYMDVFEIHDGILHTGDFPPCISAGIHFGRPFGLGFGRGFSN